MGIEGLTLHPFATADRLPSAQEMREADALAIAGGTPGLELMERAGAAVFEALKEHFSFELYRGGTVVVLCGPGNNGGDGLVVARYLKEHGYAVHAVVASATRFSAECLHQLEAFVAIEGQIHAYPENAVCDDRSIAPVTFEQLLGMVRESSLVVDALLGTGQTEAPRGGISACLDALEKCYAQIEAAKQPPILAVDIPTGVNADTGAVFEPGIHASVTVAIEAIKRGLVQYPARARCGKIEAVSIGIPVEKSAYRLITVEQLPRLQPRSPADHKGSFGTVFVIGGSEEMPGAPALSARAALRCGAGRVVTADLRGVAGPADWPEIIRLPIGAADRFFRPIHLAELEGAVSRATVVVCGPGLGQGEETVEFVGKLIALCRTKSVPVVLDADGLNAAARLGAQGLDLGGCVITPHPAEAARLLGISTAEVQEDRYGAADELIVRYRPTAVLLKGASTIVRQSDSGMVNPTGNPYLATPGSGDVLAGIIAGLIAQHIDAAGSTMLGAFLHGLVADRLVGREEFPFIASDIIAALPRTLLEVQRA